MYKVDFTPDAEQDLSRIDKTIAKRIADKIEWLHQNIEHTSQAITIYAVEHRSKVYKT